MGDAIPLDTCDRVAQEGTVGRQLAEEGTAVAHDDGYQVDGHRVEQTELKALTGNAAGRHRHGALPGHLLRLGHGSLHPVSDEVERCAGVGIDPVHRDLVGDNDHRHTHRVHSAPSSGDVEQGAAAHQRTQPINPRMPVLGAGWAHVESDPLIDSAQGDLSVLQPVEESPDRVVFLGDVTIERHRRGSDDLSHAVLLEAEVGSLVPTSEAQQSHRPGRKAIDERPARADLDAADRRLASFEFLLAQAGVPANVRERTTPHEAMRMVLEPAPGYRMPGGELAREIDPRGLYRMRDGSPTLESSAHALARGTER